MTTLWGRRARRAALLAAGLALAACASTRIVESWKAPGTGPLQFDKVLALAVVQNDDIRRTAEDALAAELPKAVQSYKVIELAELEDRPRLREKLQQGGFDGVVTLRLASAREELSWAPEPQPGGATFSGFYGYGYTAGLVGDTVVRLQINIYSLAEDKLLWSGVSQSLNPKDTDVLVYEIVQAAAGELRRQGLSAGRR